MKILIGADPEFFLKKDGKLVSAYGLIPGTKKKPFKVEGGAIQVDGMAVEFNVNPSSTAEEFSLNITSILGELRRIIPEEYEFCFDPVAEFGHDYISEQPLEARELGCDPDFNVYTMDHNEAPNGDLGFRTGAGHIHIGWTEGMDISDPQHIEACVMLAKQLDHCLGIPSRYWDGDRKRSSMYGNLGNIRIKSYGMEYRTLSNAWLNHSPLWNEIFKVSVEAFDNLVHQNRYFNHQTPVEESTTADYWDVKNDFRNWFGVFRMKRGFLNQSKDYKYQLYGLCKGQNDEEKLSLKHPKKEEKLKLEKFKKYNLVDVNFDQIAIDPLGLAPRNVWADNDEMILDRDRMIQAAAAWNEAVEVE